LSPEAKVLRIEESEPKELPGGGIFQPIVTREITNLDVTISKARFCPGTGHRWHSHEHEDEILFVLSGKGIMYFDDYEINYYPNMVITIPKGAKHQNINTGEEDVVLLSVQIPHKK